MIVQIQLQMQVVIDRRSNSLRNRDGGKPKFIGFYLAVEQKITPASDYAEVSFFLK